MLHISQHVFNFLNTKNGLNINCLFPLTDPESALLSTETKRKIKVCVLKCFIDSFIVGGIVFCASVPVLGFDNVINNICIAGYSALFGGGLTFFTEIRSSIKQLL